MIAGEKFVRDDRVLRVDLQRARELMLAAAVALPAETVSLNGARDRVAADTTWAIEDLVPYARSAMDGYALRAADTNAARGGELVLPVVGGTFAGEAPGGLAAGTASAIATGAPLPLGADAVVPIERVERRPDSIVLTAPLEPGDHVFPAGDDAKRGEVLLRAGDVVTPGRAALLAAAGHATVRVHRRPRVAIVSTGDEVVPVDVSPRAGQIRNSNAAMLAAQVGRDGADVVFDAHAGDSRRSLQAILRDALAVSDLVITTGGASVGERDLVKGTLAELGARFAFRSVALRPAKPTAFATHEQNCIAVLPGNPAAAYIAYGMLVRGVVRRLAGHLDPSPAALVATLDGAIREKAERHFVMFGKLSYREHAFVVVPLGNQCSSLVRTSADANAFIVIPPGNERLAPGARVVVEVIDWNGVIFEP